MVLRKSIMAHALLRAFVRPRPTVSLAVFGEACDTTYELASTVQACQYWKLLSTQPEQLRFLWTWMLLDLARITCCCPAGFCRH